MDNMITNAQGQPNLAASGTSGGWILTHYSRVWNVRYWAEHFIPRITTSKYFSELQKGDKVEIPVEPTVTFNAYENGQETEDQKINPSSVELTIDKAGYFKVPLTDVDEALSHLDLANKYMEAGLKGGQESIETAFFADIATKGAAANMGATAGVKSSGYNLGTSGAGISLNSSTIVEFLERGRSVLAEQNADRGKDLWVVFPTWVRHLLMTSNLANAMQMGDSRSIQRTGNLGEFDGMKMYTSNLLTGAGTGAAAPSPIIWGNKDAIAYTLRMSKSEKFRTEHFQTKIQGLMVYGWGVVKSEGLSVGWAYKGAEA